MMLSHNVARIFNPPPERNPVSVARGLARSLGLQKHYGGEKGLTMTAETLSVIDDAYGAVDYNKGLFTASDHSPKDVARGFYDISLNKWLKGHRPSLPGMVDSMLQDMGIDSQAFQIDSDVNEEEKKLVNAILLVALRAEYVRGKPRAPESWKEANDYHNSGHNLHVLTLSNYLMDVTVADPDIQLTHFNAKSFSRADRLSLILMALMHDVDHPGRGNPKDARVANENHSVDVVEPILLKAGLSKNYIQKMRAMICTTSPNGMIAALKSALKEANTLNPDRKILEQLSENFPELMTSLRFSMIWN